MSVQESTDTRFTNRYTDSGFHSLIHLLNEYFVTSFIAWVCFSDSGLDLNFGCSVPSEKGWVPSGSLQFSWRRGSETDNKERAVTLVQVGWPVGPFWGVPWQAPDPELEIPGGMHNL